MPGSPDAPEIEWLRDLGWGVGRGHPIVRLDEAESAIRSALDRQAREIVEDARAEAAGDVSPPIAYALRWFASRVEQRFAPKEAGDA